MKKTIKIIIILKIATLVFAVYPMQEAMYVFDKKELSDVNPLLCLNKLAIKEDDGYHWSRCVFEYDPLFDEKGLALSITTIKFFEEQDSEKSTETLKIISTAISQGVPISSKYNPVRHKAFPGPIRLYLSKKPISVFMVIENWFKEKPLVDKKNALMTAIFQGEQERLQVCDELIPRIRDGSGIDIPEDLVSLILSFLLDYNNEKRIALIQQAEQKFYSE